MKTIQRYSLHLGLFLLYQCLWYFLFIRFDDLVGMLVEKCHLRASEDFYAVVYEMHDWSLGWSLAYGIPVLAFGAFVVFMRKNKLVHGWLCVLCLEFLGAFLSIVLIIHALIFASWGLWW